MVGIAIKEAANVANSDAFHFKRLNSASSSSVNVSHSVSSFCLTADDSKSSS